MGKQKLFKGIIEPHLGIIDIIWWYIEASSWASKC